MNPLAFLTTGVNSLLVTLIVALVSLTGGTYLGYEYQKNYYEAKISKDALKQKENYDKALAAAQVKFNLAVGQLFTVLQEEQTKSSGYQAQARALHLANASGVGGANCHVSYGFIRLFNASATGQSTEPASSDAIASTIDLDTVLATIIDNHGKYRQAAGQIEAIRAAE